MRPREVNAYLRDIEDASMAILDAGSAMPRKNVDFRNLLVHGYSAVEADRVWDILLAEVRALLPPA